MWESVSTFEMVEGVGPASASTAAARGIFVTPDPSSMMAFCSHWNRRGATPVLKIACTCGHIGSANAETLPRDLT
jgi:hypothetical protein